MGGLAHVGLENRGSSVVYSAVACAFLASLASRGRHLFVFAGHRWQKAGNQPNGSTDSRGLVGGLVCAVLRIIGFLCPLEGVQHHLTNHIVIIN